MSTKLRDTQSKLASFTEDQNQAELNARRSTVQLQLTSAEFTSAK